MCSCPKSVPAFDCNLVLSARSRVCPSTAISTFAQYGRGLRPNASVWQRVRARCSCMSLRRAVLPYLPTCASTASSWPGGQSAPECRWVDEWRRAASRPQCLGVTPDAAWLSMSPVLRQGGSSHFVSGRRELMPRIRTATRRRTHRRSSSVLTRRHF